MRVWKILSSLPNLLQKLIQEYDKDGDGDLDDQEVRNFRVKATFYRRKENEREDKLPVYCVFFLCLAVRLFAFYKMLIPKSNQAYC